MYFLYQFERKKRYSFMSGVYIAHLFQHTPSFRGKSFKFMMRRLNLTNSWPWSGLVKQSPIISPVGQYATEKSLSRILSVIKKYRTFRCLVRLLLDFARCAPTRSRSDCPDTRLYHSYYNPVLSKNDCSTG